MRISTSGRNRPKVSEFLRFQLPPARAGMTVGLLGGSFDPPHAGHAHITKEALKRFRLDHVWWLVSPGNPLKSRSPAPLEKRFNAAKAMMQHPKVTVTDIEARIGTRYTAETLSALGTLYVGVRFIWLMGADNLAGFHHWDRWEWIIQNVPLGVLARPGERISARTSIAANRYRDFRLPAAKAPMLPKCSAPVWSLLNVPMLDLSSSEIRARGDW